MKHKQLIQKVLVSFAFVLVLFALGACQPLDEPQEETAEVQATEEPTAPVGGQEAPDEVEADEAANASSSEIPMTGDIEMEQIASATEFFTLEVPVGWSTEEVLPGANFEIANSEQALVRYRNGQAIESGDFILNIGFLPYRLLQTNELRSLDFQFDAPVDIFFQSIMPMFRTADDLVVSEPQLVSLNDKREAGLITVSEEGQEGAVLLFAAGDSVIALVSSVAFPGEMDQFQAIVDSVAVEVEFSGDQDALYGVLLGG
jgi:hypothetical protein